MTTLDYDAVYRLNANEARKRELRVQLARVKGQMDASASLAKMMARLNQDTGIQRDALDEELKKLEEGQAEGSLDDWGKYSLIDHASHAERFAAKAGAFSWVLQNPAATFEEAVGQMRAGMLAHRTALGRPWLLQDPASLVLEWQANAVESKFIQTNSWEAFRDFLLTLTPDEALGLAG